MGTMLHILDLSFRYRNRPVFAGVNLTIKPGQLIHLKGPNGIGKSTLLATIAGLLPAATGQILMSANSQAEPKVAVSDIPSADRRQVLEYVPAEANGLFLKMDALDNLRFWTGLRGRGVTDADLLKELNKWQLDHPLVAKNFPVYKFSTGMKRRLCLARLNLSETTGWLLDEPLYGLDQTATVTFQQIVRNHLSLGGFGLVVSHDLNPFERLITDTFQMGASVD